MSIQRLVVISDAHLGAVPQPVEDALLGFLDRVPALGDGLLVNGDLFGFWFTYRRAIPRVGVRVVARLAALARLMPVLMTGGNHDRWGDGPDGESFWERELGLRFGAHELRFALGSGTVLALHGDGVSSPVWTSRLKHALLRRPLASAAYRALPAELGFWVAGRLARMPRPETAARREDEAARRQRAWAENRLRDAADLSLLIMGHSHRPAAEELFRGRRYLNPGAWFEGYRYAVATESALELSQFRG